MANQLFYGDNLTVLRESIADASVDLIYLDPPFNSNATYNVLFRAPAGKQSEAQIEAFADTWHWGESAARAFDDVLRSTHTDAAALLAAMRRFLGESDMMAYLAMMAVRLVELHRVLKPAGSLYLHCDPTAGHYLKLLMDAFFKPEYFINEIIWKRYGAHNDIGQGSRHYGRVHDTILFYSKSNDRLWNQMFIPLDSAYITSTYNKIDPESGRHFTTTPLTGPGGVEKGNPVFEWNGHPRAWRYAKVKMQELHDAGRLYYSKTGYARQKFFLEESKGVPVQSIWTDIPSLSGAHAERLGYPTQKPLALLERIINASSNEGSVVLDPFCGCGTAVHAAEKLKRSWIGIDITHLAVSLIERRLKDAFPDIRFEVLGTPKDLGGARDLAARDKYQFQWWAVSLVDAVPQGGKKKGMDRGIDGIRWVRTGPKDNDVEKVLVSVKGGETVGAAMVRDLKGTIERENAAAGLFVTLAEPTREMRREAAASGLFETSFGRHPKIQILTIHELLAGMKPDLPALGRHEGFRRAARERGKGPEQTGLDV